MTTRPAPFIDAPDALHLELTRERIQSARRINLLRLWGVSGFFALFLVLGGLLRLPAWTGNLHIFTVYWAIAFVVFWASRRFELVARSARFTIALLDMPMVFFLQWATFETSPSASGIAGFTVGVYVLLVILAALSLEHWSIVFTAAVGAGLEVLLQHLAGVSEGAMASTVILLALTAVACSYARTRLVELVMRVDRDIAAQRQAERALRQSDRMASLGTLAAGVAHEINTPLTYVVTNLALIAERLSPQAPDKRATTVRSGLAARVAEVEETLGLVRAGLDSIRAITRSMPDELRHKIGNGLTTTLYALGMVEQQLAALPKEEGAPAPGAGATAGPLDLLLQQAREGADRVRTIVRDLKTFSRPDEDTARPVDLHRILRSSINLAAIEIRERASLRTELGPAPHVMGSEARLGQVFINLLVNAAQAIPEGAATRNEIGVTTRTDAAGRAVVEVRDTGSGIAPDVLGRLFDPFFTTKPVGVGTGLGLSICHGIVTALGGELSVESELGRGSTFRVALPPAPVSAEAPVEATPVPGSKGPSGHILVVDDDELVGDVIRVSLAGEHDVVVTTAASEVLQRLAAGERFDLILCDLMMPVMTGVDLYEELKRRDSAQADRMIFLTGGAFTPRAREFLSRVSNPKLEKPFDPQGLRNLVREALTSSAAAGRSG